MAQKSTKNDRRSAAREKARQIAQAQARKQRTARRVLYSGVALVAVLVIVVVGVLIYQSNRPAAAPAGFVNGSVTFVKGEKGAVLTAPQNTEGKDVPQGLPAADSQQLKKGAPAIDVYLDYQCPACGQFEALNGEPLKKLASQGEVSITFHPLALLDRFSNGNKYSTRAANLVACTVDSGQADKFQDLSLTLFGSQPEENSNGMSDDELFSLAQKAGVDLEKKIATGDGKDLTVKQCGTEVHFENYLSQQTKAALKDGLEGTPTIKINGEEFKDWSDQKAFFAQIIKETHK